jgi:hypothetical protein
MAFKIAARSRDVLCAATADIASIVLAKKLLTGVVVLDSNACLLNAQEHSSLHAPCRS